MSKSVTGTAYLIIEGERYRYGTTDPITGLKPVNKAKIVGVRQTRPKSLDLDQIVVKVTIQLPSAAFDPIAPQALIVVPEEMIMHEIEVTADEAVS
jgi:hypothetical protein